MGGIWNYVPCPEGAPKDQAIPQINPFAGLDEPIWDSSNAKDVLGKQDREKASFLSPLYDRLETNIPRGLMGFQDMAMLCIGGKERTEEGFGKVVREAGLVVEKIWDGAGVGRFVVIECRLAD